MRLLLILTLLTLPALAREPKSIQVQGSCEKKVIPDRGSLTFSVENQSTGQSEALKKTQQQLSDLRKRLDKLKLEKAEFKTTALTLHPVREWEKDRLAHKGHQARVVLEVETSQISRLGEAMQEASAAGVQNVGSMVNFLSKEKYQAEYLNCLNLAAEDARQKALQLAHKFDLKLGEVLTIIESPLAQAPPERPIFQAKMMLNKAMNEESSLPVEVGAVPFSTTIQVIFAIK